MRIPSRNVVGWANEVINQCTVSRASRIQRGSLYRNLFLTGSSDGDPQIYPKTYAYIDNLSSFLYSPVELRFMIDRYGMSNAVEKAKRRAAASELHKYMRRGGVDIEIEEAVTWSLVKGKCFIQLLWGADGFEPYVVQPEMMGVLREDIESLDRQEAFVNSVYLTPSRFAEMVSNRRDRDEIMKKVMKYSKTEAAGENSDMNNKLKTVILGGINPYTTSSSPKAGSKGRGMVDWLTSPQPDLSPEVLASLIRLDELWIWDDERDDYTTIQTVGSEVILSGEITRRNIFADMFDPDNTEKAPKANPNNPLAGQHPFKEICPNRLTGYFWGRSELCNVALIQEGINQRINGINGLLRRQEDPPRIFSGGGPPNANAYAKLKKPGGYLVDNNPNVKVQTLAPELPPGLYDALHEGEAMFDQMAGFTPTMSGRGESGVRAGAHAEKLTQNASPRFKDRALIVERQIDSIGSLSLDMLKAKVPDTLEAWVMPDDKSIEASLPPDNEIEQPPIQGMKKIEFTFHDLDDKCKVVVDSHSSSPAFSGETRGLMFDLFKLGLASGEEVIQHTQPPGADEMIENLIEGKIAKQRFAAEHPEAAIEAETKGKKKK